MTKNSCWVYTSNIHVYDGESNLYTITTLPTLLSLCLQILIGSEGWHLLFQDGWTRYTMEVVVLLANMEQDNRRLLLPQTVYPAYWLMYVHKLDQHSSFAPVVSMFELWKWNLVLQVTLFGCGTGSRRIFIKMKGSNHQSTVHFILGKGYHLGCNVVYSAVESIDLWSLMQGRQFGNIFLHLFRQDDLW